MPRISRVLCALVVGLLAGCTPTVEPVTTNASGSAAASSTRLLGGRPMVDCTITSKPPVTTAPALCGTLEVPEDRDKPLGRQVRLRVAVVPAQADSPEADALFALAGGPSEAATAFFGWLPGQFSEVHATRDIVLVDQRGTGGSNELDPAPDPGHQRPDSGRRRLAPAGLVRGLAGNDPGGPPPVHQHSRRGRPRRGTPGARLRPHRPLRDLLRCHPRPVLHPPAPRPRPGGDHGRWDPARRAGVRAHGRQQPGGARAPVRPLRRRRCLRRRPAGAVSRVVGAGGGARDRNRHRADRSGLRRAGGGDARPSRTGPPPGAAGPEHRRPAAAGDPPRPRGADGHRSPDRSRSRRGTAATGWR